MSQVIFRYGEKGRELFPDASPPIAWLTQCRQVEKLCCNREKTDVKLREKVVSSWIGRRVTQVITMKGHAVRTITKTPSSTGANAGVTSAQISSSAPNAGKPAQQREAGDAPPIYRRLRRSASMPDLKNATRVRPTNEPPFLVATFDSSNGGLIATKNIKAMLDYIFGPDEFRLVPILDHANAPYGNIEERGDLVGYVKSGLTVAEAAEFDSVIMACNTACTAFKNSKTDRAGINLEKRSIKVHDLIENTAKDVAINGGRKPVILSTEVTAKDNMYENRIRAESKKLLEQEKNELKTYGQKDELTDDEKSAKARLENTIDARKNLQVVRIGAGNESDAPGQDWASLINSLKHLSARPEHQAEVDREIARYVNADTIPHDATSIYLCCTHFPAFKQRIEEQLERIGRGHIKVVDPMQVQVRALIKQFWSTKTFELDDSDKFVAKNKLDRSNRKTATQPVVVTSGTKQGVKSSISRLLDPKPAKVLYRKDFSNNKTGEDLKKQLHITDNNENSSGSDSDSSNATSDSTTHRQTGQAATAPSRTLPMDKPVPGGTRRASR